ncbi:UDP-N-acetylmuramate dehydrogenase [Candidatus Roizmanbacteria bacterium]|nr:UDP-N-acetylmuramate dehydrogenase [Candidatus Roizmanbacteria bacterium]
MISKPITIEKNKELRPFLSNKIKSFAQFFFEAKTREDLLAAKKKSLEMGVKLIVLGGGSNLAATNNRVSGLVVKNSYVKKTLIEERGNYIFMSVSSGYPVTKLINENIEHGYSGLEYHFGLPGTVGGAICMNSKWTKPLTYFGDCLVEAWLVDDSGMEKKVGRDYFRFGYDYSFIQDSHEIFLDGLFRFKKESPEVLKKRAQESLVYRKETQPFGKISSGCFFKNISEREQLDCRLPTKSAGYLIDKAGLKKFRVGGIYVSDKHANFILNDGSGSPSDLKKMIEIIKDTVKKKFGIELKEEVVII